MKEFIRLYEDDLKGLVVEKYGVPFKNVTIYITDNRVYCEIDKSKPSNCSAWDSESEWEDG